MCNYDFVRILNTDISETITDTEMYDFLSDVIGRHYYLLHDDVPMIMSMLDYYNETILDCYAIKRI